jgi:hypothetical protein
MSRTHALQLNYNNNNTLRGLLRWPRKKESTDILRPCARIKFQRAINASYSMHFNILDVYLKPSYFIWIANIDYALEAANNEHRSRCRRGRFVFVRIFRGTFFRVGGGDGATALKAINRICSQL